MLPLSILFAGTAHTAGGDAPPPGRPRTVPRGSGGPSGPKPPLRSRLFLLLLAGLCAMLLRQLIPWLPDALMAESVKLLVEACIDWLAVPALGGALALNWRDRQNAPSRVAERELDAAVRDALRLSGELEDSKPRRHERGFIAVNAIAVLTALGAGALVAWVLLRVLLPALLRAVLVLVAIPAALGVVGLCGGCSAAPLRRCALVMRDHPTQPAPAAEVELDCDGTRLRWLADELVTADETTGRCDHDDRAP